MFGLQMKMVHTQDAGRVHDYLLHITFKKKEN